MNKRNRIVSLCLAATIALSSVPFVAHAATFGTVTASNVNLRKSNSTTSASLGKLSKDVKVEVLAKSGDWYKIKANGKTGYVMKSYVKLTSSTSSSGTTSSASTTSSSSSSSSSSSLTGTAKANATVYKTAKAASNNKLTTVKKGAKFPITAQTNTFYKITVGGKAGYIAKSSVTATKASTSQKDTTKKPDTRPGDKVGYTTSNITKPAETLTSRMQVINAINWNLTQMNTSFSLKIKNFDYNMMPTRMSELERYFVDTLDRTEPKALGNNISQIDYTVKYNDAGLVVLDMVKGKAIPASETKALEIKKVATKVVNDLKGKSEYQKIVYIHDYVVKNSAYDLNEPVDPESRNPYGVLVKGTSNCQGYAETLQMLYTVSGIENRFVWASSRITQVGTHGFNKVKLSGKWYNVDATVDDPKDTAKIYGDRTRHDYLLVTDAVSAQRYSFEYSRYPAANTKNNWHTRNKLTANSQASLEKLVKAGVSKKQKYVSVWVDDYSSKKYNTAFVKKLSGVKDVKISTVQSYTPSKPYATALFFAITYK